MVRQQEKSDNNFLHSPKRCFYWDWFSENPVELVLLAFVLIFFFFMPHLSCGIRPSDGKMGGRSVHLFQDK